MRRLFIFCSAGLLALALTLGCAEAPEPPPRHIYLVTIDTLRADHLGCMGYPRAVSPFIDRLAAEGVLFTQAYASSSTTVACHASLFTSLQPPQHQMIRNGVEMHPSLFTMAEMFGQAGYETAGFSTVNFMKTLAKGFDVFDTERKYFDSEHVLGKALRWLEGRDGDRPFLVWLHLFDVHEWYKPEHVAEETLAVAAGLSPSGAELAAYLRREHGFYSQVFGGEQEMLAAVDRYDGQILAVDTALERFFDAVEAAGWNDDALWILTTDHGEGLSSHGFKGHGEKIYNEQIRAPLIFYSTAGRYGQRRVDRLVRHVDILPTLAELVGGDLGTQAFPVVGHSLLPLLENRRRELPARYAFAQRREADDELRRRWEKGDVFSIQSLDHKYIYHSEGRDEFYDLRRDPLESENLVDVPDEMRERMRDYAEKLHQGMAEQGRSLGRGELNPEYIEELKALGYL